MIIPRTHDPVHEIALIRQKQQPFRILIQPSDRIDTQRIIKVLRHRRLISLFLSAADDSPWLVKQQEYFLLLLRDRVSVQTDYCIYWDSLSCLYGSAIQRNPPRIGKLIGIPPGAYTCIA